MPVEPNDDTKMKCNLANHGGVMASTAECGRLKSRGKILSGNDIGFCVISTPSNDDVDLL
jgi:hypothetical protein